MRVTFVLPGYARTPVGGYKVVYEYATRLARRGHRVTIVHPHRWRRGGWRDRLHYLAWRQRNRILDSDSPPWFDLDPSVDLRFVPELAAGRLPPGDVLVATAWQTAAAVAAAPASCGAGFYLIQGYEAWSGDVAEVDASWRLPLRKVVISRWLYEIATEMGEAGRTTRIPNGLDLDAFRLRTPPAERDRPRIGLLYHDGEWKGSAEGVEALRRVRASHPGVACLAFGTLPRPSGLPEWIDYRHLPEPEALPRLYDSCTIFLQTSRAEGWGLTATEAMACGCALVTTDNGGSRDYAIEGETALVVPPRDPGALAGAIRRLLDDDALRIRLAHAGHAHVQRYSWERAVTRIEACFRAALAP